MKQDDRPSLNSLRDTLFRKIEHSKLMHVDISSYRTFNEGHAEKTYEFLIDMIKCYIARGKQEGLLKERERAVKISLTSTKTTPALEDAEKPAAPTKTKKEAAAASSSTITTLPKGIQKPRRRVKQLPFSLHHLRSLMPTRRTRKAREREQDHRRPLTRRKSFVTISSTKVDATKVTNVSTFIPRKSMMPE